MIHRFAPTIALTMGLLPLSLFACTMNSAPPAHSAVPAARALGVEQSCVPLTQIRESRVRDDRTIDFVTSGNRFYRNILPNACLGLASANSITYEARQNQLCDVDVVYPLHDTGGLNRGPACGLGKFILMERLPS